MWDTYLCLSPAWSGGNGELREFWSSLCGIGHYWKNLEVARSKTEKLFLLDIVTKELKNLHKCLRACVGVRLTEPCAGGQWVCTVWRSAAARWRGFRKIARALLLAQVQAQATLVLGAAQTHSQNCTQNTPANKNVCFFIFIIRINSLSYTKKNNIKAQRKF